MSKTRDDIQAALATSTQRDSNKVFFTLSEDDKWRLGVGSLLAIQANLLCDIVNALHKAEIHNESKSLL